MKPGTITTVGLSIGAVVVCAVALHYIRRKRRYSSPRGAWQHIGSIKDISIFPIKSSSAVQLTEAECDIFGLSKLNFHDRRVILMHEPDEEIASASTYPHMLSIRTRLISPGVMHLTAPDVVPYTLKLVDFSASNRRRFYQEMRGYYLELIEGTPEQHLWFSSAILKRRSGIRAYLSLEPIIEPCWWGKRHHEYMPIMVMHDKSVDNLNSKIAPQNRAHHLQFRGNLMIQSLDNVRPYDEDKWLWLKIGDNEEESLILRFKLPCLRCILPNINVFNSRRNDDFEPLKTLRTYRLRNHPTDPEMGVYFDVFKTGVVRRGDSVYVQYK